MTREERIREVEMIVSNIALGDLPHSKEQEIATAIVDSIRVDEKLLGSQMKYYQDAYLMNTKLRSEGYESEYVAKAISTNKEVIKIEVRDD